MILRLLQLLPDSLVEWLGVAVLAGLLCAGAFGCGWLEGRDGQREITDAVTRQLRQTEAALSQSRQQATSLADALAASQDDGADLMRRLLAAEQLANIPAATVDAPPAAGNAGRGAAPVAPAAPRAGGDRAFTEAINVW